MSFEKIAQDAYTQGLTDTLRELTVSDEIKIAAYKHALDTTDALLASGGLAATAYGAKKLKDHMDDVKQTNRLQHAGLASALFGTGMIDGLGVRDLPKGLRMRANIRNALLGAGAAGLGTYLLDDGSSIAGVDY